MSRFISRTMPKNCRIMRSVSTMTRSIVSSSGSVSAAARFSRLQRGDARLEGGDALLQSGGLGLARARLVGEQAAAEVVGLAGAERNFAGRGVEAQRAGFGRHEDVAAGGTLLGRCGADGQREKQRQNGKSRHLILPGGAGAPRNARLRAPRHSLFCAPMHQNVYKICPEALWRAAEAAGRFDGAPVDLADGYIHFSTAAQVA